MAISTGYKVSVVPLDHGREVHHATGTITTTTVNGTKFYGTYTFPRAFSEAPKILGYGTTRPDAFCSASATATVLTITVVGRTKASLPDGSVTVFATVEGPLA